MSDTATPRRHADPVEPDHASAPRGRGARWVTPIFWLNWAVEIGIIVTGGLVRLTGSGLGCPTWPQCVPGSYTPTREMAMGIHPYIEFGNRLLTFVVAIAAIGVLTDSTDILAWVDRQRPDLALFGRTAEDRREIRFCL